MESYDWVQIMEPDSHKVVYANPITGKMQFDPPQGEQFKPMSENQWWELLDPTSNSHYYHNPHNGETVWERPQSADIISLTLMQSTSSNVEESTDSVAVDKQDVTNDIDTNNVDQGNHVEADNNPQVEADNNLQVISVSEENTVPAVVDSNGSFVGTPKENRKNSDAFRSPLETLSPFCVDYEGQRFSSLTDDAEDQNNSDKHVSILDPDPQPLEEKVILEAPNSKDVTPETNSKRKHSRPTSDTTNIMTDDERRRLESFLVISMKDVNPPTAVPGSPRRAKSEKNKKMSLGATTTIDGPVSGRSVKPHNRSHSQGIPPAPIPPSVPMMGMSRSMSLQVQPGKSLEHFGSFATHKTGFFRKKVTIANMLSFTKDPIKQPMILQRDKDLRKDSINLFKLVLEYMGNRKGRGKGTDQLALQIVCKCWEKKGLRDELYVQLCRQTTCNPKKESLKRGWQLFTICLSIFPPSIKFQSYLEGYLWRNVEPSEINRGIPVEVYAKFCHKRVEKITRSGAKKGLVKPTLEEIQQAKNAPFNPSVFGALLEEVMELQQEKHPDLPLPWVMIELCDVVLRLRGPYTQGIFRIPGDIDAVNALKLCIDKWKSVPDSYDDPHIPASLLKLWFRELEDPLIPENYYESCIANFNNPGNALSIIHSLPKLNKEVLLYIVEFLQKFTTNESSHHTKMGLDNVAMVWAPNFLRCPSDDHVLIFENTRKEMAFVRILLSDLNKPSE